MKKFFTSPLGIVVLIVVVYFGYQWYKKQDAIKRNARILVTDPTTMRNAQTQAQNEGRSVTEVLADRARNMAESNS